MSNKDGIISAKLPEDLYMAAAERAESEGISLSELVRVVMTQFIYGTMPSFTEGYEEAKKLAYRLASRALRDGFASLPETPEEAFQLAREGKI
jgi:hypothetical protein